MRPPRVEGGEVWCQQVVGALAECPAFKDLFILAAWATIHSACTHVGRARCVSSPGRGPRGPPGQWHPWGGGWGGLEGMGGLTGTVIASEILIFNFSKPVHPLGHKGHDVPEPCRYFSGAHPVQPTSEPRGGREGQAVRWLKPMGSDLETLPLAFLGPFLHTATGFMMNPCAQQVSMSWVSGV